MPDLQPPPSPAPWWRGTRAQRLPHFLTRYLLAAAAWIYFATVGRVAMGLLPIHLFLGPLPLFYAAGSTAFLVLALRRPLSVSSYRWARSWDLLALLIAIPHDPLLATPSLLVLLVLVLEAGLGFGRQVYLETLGLAVLVAIASVILRAGFTDIGLPQATVYLCVFTAFLGVYGDQLVRMVHRYQSELEQQSRNDPLTGLLNRRGLQEASLRLFARSSRKKEPIAVLYGDLDGFKLVNDHCGHAVGDRVLQEVAELIQGQLRPYDLVARCGGDEFAILMPDAGEAQAIGAVERIRAAVEQLNAKYAIQLGISLGIALAPGDGIDLEAVLKVADQSMYRMKRRPDKPV